MKTLHFFAGLLYSLPLLADDYEFYLDQRNIVGEGFIRTSVSQEDSMTSPMPVPEGGSEFVLWAVQNTPESSTPIWTHISTELVGAYLPQAQLQITTGDPFDDGIPRTRIDQPFTVTSTVGGLQPNVQGAPEAAKQVLFDRRVSVTLLTDTVLKPDETLTPQLHSQGLISQNGSDSEDYLSELLGEDPFSESGIETFTIHAMPDGEIASIQLAEAQVEIWPLATASFTGIEERTYNSIPEFQVKLTKVYPSSETYLQFYPGVAQNGKSGTKIKESVLIVNDTQSRDGILEFPEFEKYLKQPGDYTIEVVTKTPFGEDVLESLTFTYDNTLKIRGSLNSLN